jgi:hypothetical protein
MLPTMETRGRLAYWLTPIARLRRGDGGASSVDFALGAALTVAVVAGFAGGVHGSFGSMTRKASAALGAPAATSRTAPDTPSEWQRQIDELEKQVKERQEEVEEARDDDGLWDVFGSIFGGPVVGTQIGSAIGQPADPGEGEAAVAEQEERAALRLEAVPGWSRADDDD